MKKDPAIAHAGALLAMIGVFAAAYYFDFWISRLRQLSSQDLIALPAMWASSGLGLLTVLMALLLSLWVLTGSARNPLIHWIFLIVGLLLSVYGPLVMSGGLFGLMLPASVQIPLLLGENVLSCARILCIAGLLGLLLRSQKSGSAPG
jgi:hypothetical protein